WARWRTSPARWGSCAHPVAVSSMDRPSSSTVAGVRPNTCRNSGAAPPGCRRAADFLPRQACLPGVASIWSGLKMSDCLKFYIDGAWVDPRGGGSREIVDPVTERVAGRVAMGSEADVDAAVA